MLKTQNYQNKIKGVSFCLKKIKLSYHINFYPHDIVCDTKIHRLEYYDMSWSAA